MRIFLWILVITMLVISLIMNYIIFFESNPNPVTIDKDDYDDYKEGKNEFFVDLDESTQKELENEVRQSVRDIKTNTQKVDISDLLKDIDNPEPSYFTRVHRTMKVRWPNAFVMLKEEPLNNGLVYKWNSLTKGNKTYAFEIHSEELLICMMQTIDRIQEKNITPSADIYFYISENGNDTEFLEYLNKHDVPVNLYIKTPKNEREFDAIDDKFVLVGCEIANELHLQVDGNNFEADNINLPINHSDFLANTLTVIKDYLPFAVDMQRKMKSLQGKAIQNAINLYPDIRRNAYPLYEVKDDGIHVYHYDKENKDKILQQIQGTVVEEKDKEILIDPNSKEMKTFLDLFHAKNRKVCYVPTFVTERIEHPYPTIITNLKKSHSYDGYDVILNGLYELFTKD